MFAAVKSYMPHLPCISCFTFGVNICTLHFSSTPCRFQKCRGSMVVTNVRHGLGAINTWLIGSSVHGGSSHCIMSCIFAQVSRPLVGVGFDARGACRLSDSCRFTVLFPVWGQSISCGVAIAQGEGTIGCCFYFSRLL
jgi:hypothetical protein